MVVQGQMARVPVTARQKFDEAAYFYNGMGGHRRNPIVFPYYLSAFVSALRSVTFYMQSQYSRDERFAQWYAEKQVEMRADPVLKLLKDKRDIALHAEPFDLYFYQGFKFPERYGDCITTDHLEVKEGRDLDGNVTMTIKVGKDGETEPVEPRISWHFAEDDPLDVMNHCYTGLEKMDAMLKELEGLGLVESPNPFDVPPLQA